MNVPPCQQCGLPAVLHCAQQACDWWECEPCDIRGIIGRPGWIARMLDPNRRTT